MTALLERFRVTSPIGELAAIRARPAREPLGIALFVPGFTGSLDDFATLVQDVAAYGYEAVAYSQRGQAGSAAPTGTHDYELDALASEAALVAASISGGNLVHLVGHSLGGLVARDAVVRQPDRFASLTMLCSGPGGRPGVQSDDAAYVAAHGMGALWHRDNPRGALTPRDEFFRDRAGETSTAHYLGGARILQTTIDSTADVVATSIPVLVAHGDADDVWPIADQYDMAVRLGAEYRVIPGAGHSPNTDNPADTAKFLSQFWAEI